MKIAIFSDSHGRMEHMVAAMEEEQPDYVFFLGDNLRDGRELSKLYPKTPMKLLRGKSRFEKALRRVAHLPAGLMRRVLKK